MMADRTTKALLLAIAVGVWLSIFAQWRAAGSVEADVSNIALGLCLNEKIC